MTIFPLSFTEFNALYSKKVEMNHLIWINFHIFNIK